MSHTSHRRSLRARRATAFVAPFLVGSVVGVVGLTSAALMGRDPAPTAPGPAPAVAG